MAAARSDEWSLELDLPEVAAAAVGVCDGETTVSAQLLCPFVSNSPNGLALSRLLDVLPTRPLNLWFETVEIAVHDGGKRVLYAVPSGEDVQELETLRLSVLHLFPQCADALVDLKFRFLVRLGNTVSSTPPNWTTVYQRVDHLTWRGPSGSVTQLPFAPRRSEDDHSGEVVAVDVSGSTIMFTNYWKTVRSIWAAAAAHNDNVKVLLWSSVCKLEPDKYKFNQLLADQGRSPGLNRDTEPATVSRWCVENNFHGTLHFITDGQVNQASINACDKCLNSGGGWHFKQVNAYVLQNCHSTEDINVSCTVPFTRSSPSKVWGARLLSNLEVFEVQSVDPYALIRSISSQATFMAQRDQLSAQVAFACAGSTDQQLLRKELLAMQARINRASAREATVLSSGQSGADPLYAALRRGDLCEAEGVARNMVAVCTGSCPKDWISVFNRLLDMTKGALRNVVTVNGIRANAAHFADSETKQDVSSVQDGGAPALAAEPYTCPVSMEDESTIPVLMFVVPEHVGFWEDLPKSLQDQVVACPLVMLAPFMRPHLTRLGKLLDHHMGLTSFREYRAHRSVSHVSGAPVMECAAVFGAGPEFVRATNSALHHAFTGGLKLGDPTAWCVVLWQLMEMTPYLAADEPLMNQVRQHVLYRMQHCQTFASLSGLPDTVNTVVPWGAAAWFVYGGCVAHYSVQPMREAGRMHIAYLHAIRRLVELQGFPVSEVAHGHWQRFSALSSMLSALKFSASSDDTVRRPATAEEQAEFKRLVQALYQNSIIVCGRNVVLLDGPATEGSKAAALALLPAAARKLSVQDILGLAGFLDPAKSMGGINLPPNWSSVPSDVPEPVWSFPETPVVQPQICLLTARPFALVGEPPVTWREAAAAAFGISDPVTQVVPTCKWFMEYTLEHDEYPDDKESFIMWVFERMTSRLVNPVKTLPSDYLECVDSVFAAFEPLVRTVPAAVAIKRYVASVRLEDRIRMETA